MDPRERLERLRDQARRTLRGRFEQEHTGWFFAGRVRLAEPGPQGRMAFETESFDLQDIPALLRRAIESGEMPAGAVQALSPGTGELHPLCKSDLDTWASRITVGRATNNDVVLRHKSVSKIHANVRIREASGESSAATPTVMDVGSHNGTRVNERRIEIDTYVPLRDGDRICFGSYEVILMSAGGLYDGLRAWH